LEPGRRDPAAMQRDLPRGQRRRRLLHAPIQTTSFSRKKSKMKTEDLLALVNSGFLQEKEMDMWCLAAGDLYPMEKNPDEVPKFARFVERALALPASDFFKGLLKYYDIEYLNLNPNGIFHVSILSTSAKLSWGSNPTGSCFRNFSV
jgi:hypothetical protein